MNEQVKNGWYLRFKESVQEDIREVISPGAEQDRVVNIINDLLTDCHGDLWWHFDEEHGFSDDIDDSLPDQFHTVYDSSLLNDIPDSGYNIIRIGFGSVYAGESFDQREFYIALSMNGCSLASALTEYYRFTVPVINRYFLYGVKRLVNVMTTENGQV
tara:strand:- start:72 stop:545 length:474 start_codon:yes stop_codon:yes gene_type:complete